MEELATHIILDALDNVRKGNEFANDSLFFLRDRQAVVFWLQWLPGLDQEYIIKGITNLCQAYQSKQ